jgi:hypothetical protein
MLDQSTLEGRIGKVLMDQMNKEISAIAEPIMQEALTKIQEEMRKRLGSIAIVLMQRHFSVERFGDELRIVVQVKEPQL